ncbi:S-adenosylmethionine decarboxylase [Trypanosoma equiperdum]|uniref:S-adenosylmethionine decarboxylase proenzyme n=7 Tax=Trypanozoon TaxID=39700 RepID=DCAMC_TRYBB|nr:S-adenosylmethionine decarboxylase [Trypanosoma brucei gambiense DAL972]XP_845558.1 S-adenosylmethionine decarboxylase proenzyme, putative [Trypanosoma brucei brucei TREU927]XP_845563.1 S-adenosylmethionine decarboxylase proenzyme, putative [Trypanosoma brucei brucei TREU927]P50244.2 RecName: Full=S-adenosylmethionine decarboxylase proenzyme; Short=AdoMetDC; Short=SAMDC; Contains: RecName: Full=S-adenosylmethionine decarboxylase alpha chain; Contains: RecName: Full=S-adenosylmethionine decarb|eukprot:XP_011774230.1 S-adenosylmethionine decarboxylase [Trypanosoma brucei gambiense DAL972]
MSSCKDSLSLMAMWGSIARFDPKHERSFEGPEKRLEVIMRVVDGTHVSGLLAHDDDVWQKVIDAICAHIVSREFNEYIRSYVLSESSLFVMKDRVILITCGTITLLNCVPLICEAVSTVCGEVEWVSFMHKNYSFPWEQKGPHLSMAEEFKTLRSHFPSGQPFIFGPIDSDHYFLYFHSDVVQPSCSDDAQLSMTMYGLDRNQTKHWYSDKMLPTGPETAVIREATGLSEVVDDSWILHDLQYEPCGYSINAIRGSEYQTIHITPEEHCSFASYETNTCALNYSKCICGVLRVFDPERFSVIVFIDPDSAVGKSYHSGGTIGVEPEYYPNYEAHHRTVNEYTPGHWVLKVNYVKRAVGTVGTSAASGAKE